MNPASCFPAALYEFKADLKKEFFDETPKPLRAIVIFVYTASCSHKPLNCSIFQKANTIPIIIDSNLNFILTQEFAWLKERSLIIHLKDTMLPDELVEKIDLIWEYSVEIGNKYEIYPAYAEELEPIKEEVKLELVKFLS